jgi:hypothetical protein
MECGKDVAQQTIADQEAIELMAVNREMPDAVKIPFVLLIDIDTDQMGHHVRKTMIVIPLNPDHRDPAFRIRQLPNVTEKLPVFFLKAAKIQIAENIAQQDQAVKRNRFQHLQSSLGTAYLRTEMQVRKDHRVVTRRVHTFYLTGCLLRDDEFQLRHPLW